jgi:hypothetical protein
MSLEGSRVDSEFPRPERPFSEKLRAIHDSWAEARDTREIRRLRTAAAQAEMLALIHAWCVRLAAQMEEIYGSLVRLSALNPYGSEDMGFDLAIGDDHQMAVSLQPGKASTSGSAPTWEVQIRLRYPEEPAWVVATWGRRNQNWTRQRIEEVLLSLLSAFERSRSGPLRL